MGLSEVILNTLSLFTELFGFFAKDPEPATIYAAAEEGKIDAVRNFLEKGIDIHKIDDFGVTAFDYACRNGHLPIAKLLLQHGADPNRHDPDGFDPMYYAITGIHPNIVEWLLNLGVNPSQKDPETGQNRLHLTSSFSADTQLKNARLLIQFGTDMNAVDTYGYTPLDCADEHGVKKMIAFLEKAGAQRNRKSETQ